jgi:hypothetical protein
VSWRRSLSIAKHAPTGAGGGARAGLLVTLETRCGDDLFPANIGKMPPGCEPGGVSSQGVAEVRGLAPCPDFLLNPGRSRKDAFLGTTGPRDGRVEKSQRGDQPKRKPPGCRGLASKVQYEIGVCAKGHSCKDSQCPEWHATGHAIPLIGFVGHARIGGVRPLIKRRTPPGR